MPGNLNRKLAAIMFTDMVGYTAMMQENEVLAKQIRDRHRQILQQSTKRHQGQILQYYGDGTLTIFQSSIEAVVCAVEIQHEFLKEPKIPLRIGIHVGDIAHDHEGIYGDGVNVASRIEALCSAGGVLISERVFDDLKNHPEFPVKNLGEFELKNVKRPIEIFGIKYGQLTIPTRSELEARTVKTFKSIAVLPFINMSADPDNEYFSEGMTEEILNALTKVEGMRVTSRTSSFAFKNKTIDIREIGRQLNVNTVLEGSVRKAGKKVRITAQLIDTKDGYHLWSETFDRQIEDIFDVQDEIAGHVVKKLQSMLGSHQIEEKLARKPGRNFEAYNLYLRGLYHMNKNFPEDALVAKKYFEDSIKLQDDFALAYARLSYCYGYLGTTGIMKPKESFQKASECAEKAMELDPDIYEPYLMHALGALYYTGDLDDAYQSLQKAKTINPGSAEVHMYYAIYLSAIGNLKEAVESMEKALEIDPLSLNIRNGYGILKMVTRCYDEAIKIFDSILESDPTYRAALEEKGWTLFFKGETEKAIETLKTYQMMTGSPLKGWSALGYVYGKTGRPELAWEIIDKLHQRHKQEPDVILAMDFAIVYAGLNEFGKAIENLKKGLKNRSGLIYMIAHPIWDDLKTRPGFQELLQELNARNVTNYT